MALISNRAAGLGLAFVIAPLAALYERFELATGAYHPKVLILCPTFAALGIAMVAYPGSSKVGDDGSTALRPKEMWIWGCAGLVGFLVGLLLDERVRPLFIQ